MASIIRSLVSMVSKEEGDSISEDEQPQVEEATSLDRQTNDNPSTNANDNPTNNDNITKSKSKKDKATKKAEKKAIKKAQKKAAKRLEKEERKRLKKEERKRLKKEAKKLEKRKLSANMGTDCTSNDSDVDIDNNIDNSIDEEKISAISTTDSNEQTTTTYITTSNTNQNQILQLIPNHIKSNFRTIGFSKWGGNGSKQGNWLPILELSPFDVEEGPVRDQWFELAEQAQETGKSMSKLIFWYGVKYEDRAQAYSFVSENKVISYEQGKLQGYNKLPSKIANKLKKKQHLTKIEEQIHRGLMEVELDVKKDKIDRGLLWLTTSKRQVYKVGTRVLKKFFDEEIGKIRPFAGTIERYDAKKKVYHILYEDGDTDMLYELEVKEILAKGGDKKLPAAKTIQECDEIGIGTKVSKSFFDEELGEIRPFAGSVVSFDAKKKYYKVVYEDGDAEDLWASDVKDILVNDKTPTKRSSNKRKAADLEIVEVETTPGRRKLPGGYARKTCLEEGCTNYTQRGGYCIKHGKKEGRRRVR